MNSYAFLNGNEAAAWGVRLCRPQVVAAYPITPQTKAVEKIAQFVQDGDLLCEYLHVESEHSAMSCSIGASSVGARTFTATSSQGLLYMAECLPYASGARLPIVMMNANRAIATPWNIYGDQMDMPYVLNSGWIQLFAENAQEALDLIIQSFRLGEDEKILAPVMVNLDGFVLTHTYEKVHIPSQEEVDAFLPAPKPRKHMMNDESPMSMCISAGNQHNLEFKIRQHRDLLPAEELFEGIDKEYEKAFGRGYGGALEGYRTEDAEHLLLATGSVCGTLRHMVDLLREERHSVGLVKMRMLRPFPVKRLGALCSGAKTLGVLDKNLSFGYEGTVFTNVNSALHQEGIPLRSYNFIGGLGGRDITRQDVRSMVRVLEESDKTTEKIHYLNVRCAL
ncbi:MAG TPA: hypothetical protein PLA80_04280 [Synergistaceae bacterium]|nr:hypothetical protein [Synergistaceae bacterium]